MHLRPARIEKDRSRVIRSWRGPVAAVMMVATTLLFSRRVEGVGLETWRTEWYRFAAENGKLIGSPSGLFWDELTEVLPFARAVWPDSAWYGTGSYWTVAPSLMLSVNSGDPRFFWHSDVSNEVRFGNLLLRQSLDADSRYNNDQDYIWKKDEFSGARIEEAFVQYEGPAGFARFGRIKRNWGPFIDRSLLLSSYPHSYDAFEWALHSSFFEFRHFFAAFPFETSWYDNDNKQDRFIRYFAGHSLALMYRDWASVGITETILFSRDKGFPDLQFVNPASFYFANNTNLEGTGNLMVGLQWRLHPFTRAVTLAGQLLFDDVQIENTGAGDKEPMHWGGDFAVWWHDPLQWGSASNITLEYRRLSRWLYTVHPGNAVRAERYIYAGKSLGHERVDGDQVSIGLEVCGTRPWKVAGGARAGRQGPGTVWSHWSESATYDTTLGTLGYRREEPLAHRTNVTTFVTPYTELIAFWREYVDVRITLESEIATVRHSDDQSPWEWNPSVSGTLTLHYSDFHIPLPELFTASRE